ncbi:diiron oxygenase [Pseudomonas syringae]|uniref:Mangotoxin biosynthesis-involved protein MgoC n=1 Tax=Pseudomonas syringae pv. lapsa TaxID=199201 RepID=A0AB74AD74_PSESX|nr:diiron oxygenase [Pseudomonas syringae]ALU62918.1 aminobenzoate oxygenase [Pseudomonas syringae pv. lapsa]KPX61546.1 Mangotoxin biosynthesis-involved protein MgoC [Pseudomonas syringae pv. lapsa]MBS7422494.1 diiron oxygenase [Pseudomonas syringae]MBS7434248.1 diiron oxygenase [Pseudomonas syringae]POD27246.1 aminobenzoate oxygenase [Pseudomonas syringae pv. syringae]
MKAEDYMSFIDAWEGRATIRTRPRRMVENDDKLIYPLSRQPLVLSDTFTRECAHLRDYALVQSLYKFINDVVIFETEIVDRTARSIAKDHFTIRFPFACRYDAMTVVVDEDYHALVAMDFMQQTIALTGIEPIPLPDEIELSRAIPAALALAPEHLRSAVELICVAIAENTVTNDVAAFAKDESVKQSVKGLMADHLLDEGRHSGFWARLVRIYWHTAPQQDRESIARIMPVFIAQYLTNDIQNGFDFTLIDHLQVPDTVKHALRDETRAVSFPVNRHHPLVANIVRFFKNSSMLDDPCVQRALADYLPAQGTLQ